MDETTLYGNSYTDEDNNDIYLNVYRGLYTIQSTNSHKRYPALRMILGMNLTKRCLWKQQKHPKKVTEIVDGFLRLAPYTVCRELSSVLLSLECSPQQITELLAVIASKSDDPTLKTNGAVVSF